MDRYRNILTSLALFCVGGVFVYAQGGYKVTGTVQDDLGPVIGATVVEKGTASGTSTDLDGRFNLVVEGPDAEVEISCIGCGQNLCGYTTVVHKSI